MATSAGWAYFLPSSWWQVSRLAKNPTIRISSVIYPLLKWERGQEHLTLLRLRALSPPLSRRRRWPSPRCQWPLAATKPADNKVWNITPADRQRYDHIFNTLGPVANKIHGNKIRGVMLNSKLPNDVLGKFWDLSDLDKDGSLDRAEFTIAMQLIYKVLDGHAVPAGGLPPCYGV